MEIIILIERNNNWFLKNLKGSLNLYLAQMIEDDVIMSSPNKDKVRVDINNGMLNFFII